MAPSDGAFTRFHDFKSVIINVIGSTRNFARNQTMFLPILTQGCLVLTKCYIIYSCVNA